MRLTLTLLGWTLDLNLGLDTVEAEDTCSLDGGTTSAYPIGFTGQWTQPLEWQPPERTIPWPEEE
jgi:hypothetical protein